MSQLDKFNLPLASSLQQVVGALLFGADRPLTVEEIRACLKSVADSTTEPAENTVSIFAEASPNEVRDALESIAKELSRLQIGFELVEINRTFRFQTQACCGRWVRNLLKVDRPNRLSRPALETLAIVAYRQPATKSEIEAIRGVMVDHMLKALMELHLVRIVGRSELPGRPFLYGTTATFLDHFGLSTLKELNELDPTLQRSNPTERQARHKKEPRAASVEVDTLFAASAMRVDKSGQATPNTSAIAEVSGTGGRTPDPARDEPVYDPSDDERGTDEADR